MEEDFNKNMYFILGVIFSGVGGFLLGGLFIYTIYTNGVSLDNIEYTPLGDQVEELKQGVYASVKGTKYYPVWCNSNIKEENRIDFDSVEEAIDAGYLEIAKSCL